MLILFTDTSRVTISYSIPTILFSGSFSQQSFSSSTSSNVKRTRNRIADPNLWARNIRENFRVTGQQHTDTRGNFVAEKMPHFADCSKCRYKCSDKILQEQQINICKHYWSVGDFSLQNEWLCDFIKELPIERRRPSDVDSNRQRGKSRVFSLPDSQGQNQRVCLKFFCAVLSISFQRINRAFK